MQFSCCQRFLLWTRSAQCHQAERSKHEILGEHKASINLLTDYHDRPMKFFFSAPKSRMKFYDRNCSLHEMWVRAEVLLDYLLMWTFPPMTCHFVGTHAVQRAGAMAGIVTGALRNKAHSSHSLIHCVTLEATHMAAAKVVLTGSLPPWS